MAYKLVSLYDLVKLSKEELISKNYVSYLCSFYPGREYHHNEILDIEKLLKFLGINDNCSLVDGFIFGYVVPHLNKEMDLLKITSDMVINIELKSGDISLNKVLDQLKQNRYFTNVIGKKHAVHFTYKSVVNKLYKLENKTLVESTKEELLDYLKLPVDQTINLDEIYDPKNILVSPLNNNEKFIEGKYILTPHQRDIKKKIKDLIKQNKRNIFALTGSPGTGKTLLLYDLAYDFSLKGKVLIINVETLSEGHKILNEKIENLTIKELYKVSLKTLDKYDYIFFDETQRIYPYEKFFKIVQYIKENHKKCVFSYDANQVIFNSENAKKVISLILHEAKDTHYRLTNKIRSNVEVISFIDCVFNLNNFNKEIPLKDSCSIIYEPDEKKAIKRALDLNNKDYTFISYPIKQMNPNLDENVTILDSNEVVGQDFQKVVMILNSYFYYQDGELKGKELEGTKYPIVKMLYQGLTRARENIILIITDKELLINLLSILN